MIEDLGYRRYKPTVNWKALKSSRSLSYRLVLLAKLFFGEQSTWYVSIVALLCRITRIRFIRFQTFAFGHLLLEPDLFLKEKALKTIPRYFYLWIIDRQTVSNPALLEIWRSRIPSIRVPFIDLRSLPLENLYQHPGIFFDVEKYITAINKTGEFGRIQALWGNRAPVLSLPSDIKLRGYEQLEKMGVPSGSWFACVHCRESGYHKYARGQEYRNANIATYESAIDYIIEQGGWVIRLGDASMSPIPEKARLIDYALRPEKSDWFDLFLGSEAKFTLGSGSGPASMSASFGKPMALPNSLPLSSVPFYCHDHLGLATPKLLRSKDTGCLLSFSEIMNSDAANYRWYELYENDGLEILDNDDEDILAIAKELNQMADMAFQMSKEDEIRQQKMKALFRKGHFGYQSNCLFSPAFLKRYEHLLPS